MTNDSPSPKIVARCRKRRSRHSKRIQAIRLVSALIRSSCCSWKGSASFERSTNRTGLFGGPTCFFQAKLRSLTYIATCDASLDFATLLNREPTALTLFDPVGWSLDGGGSDDSCPGCLSRVRLRGTQIGSRKSRAEAGNPTRRRCQFR